jgi:hypothetical protein
LNDAAASTPSMAGFFRKPTRGSERCRVIVQAQSH